MKEFGLGQFGVGTTKGRLAELLDISERSVHYYHSFAMKNCDEFSKDYPKIGREVLTGVPMTQYQCWVIWVIGSFIHEHKVPKRLLSHHLFFKEEYQAKVSHAAFDEFCKYQGGSHESARICSAA